MPINNAIASLAVKDLANACAWYETLFERAADSTPMPDLAEWKFPGGGWLQIYWMPDRAGKGSLTLAVTDIDEIAARLGKLGIDSNQQSASATVKTLMITDPDGNLVVLAQALDKTIAR